MARDKNHHLRKIGNIWYFEKMVSGKRIKKALAESVTEARRMRDQYVREIDIYGDIQRPEPEKEKVLFGEVAVEWIQIKKKEIKPSTLRDYRSSMNYYILPHFGNMPIHDIGYLDIKRFVGEFECSAKRINNVLIPLRSLFEFAKLSEIIEKDPMDLVKNLKIDKPDIYPLSMDEVKRFLEVVSPWYKNFFVAAFFTGMRFGEMSALKWRNVDFRLGVIKVRETRVMKQEGRPKTSGSVRDIKMLLPVVGALRNQRKYTMGKSEYVFLNQQERPLLSDSVNEFVWKTALKKAGLEPRSLYQTRHTFATLMLDAGELPGWVQQMMGHETLKMIHEHYYTHIKNYQRDDGSAFMEKVYSPCMDQPDEGSNVKEACENFTPILHQEDNGNFQEKDNFSLLLSKDK